MPGEQGRPSQRSQQRRGALPMRSGLMAQLQAKNRLLAESEAKVRQLELQLKPVEPTIEGDTWDSRVCLLVGDSKSSKEGLHCSGFAYAWNQKWPLVDIGKYQPCRQIKRSIKNYVPGVVVTEDDHIVLAAQPRRQSRSRSPHCIPRVAVDHFAPDTRKRRYIGERR